MLSSESLAIAEMFRDAVLARYGNAELDVRFCSFDTICSATQDRQDAIAALLDQRPLDLMIVIGGYNSSNTCNLARMCEPRVPTFHIAEPAGLMSPSDIRHKPVGGKGDRVSTGWLPLSGPVSIGLTSGASTPDNLVGTVIRRLDAFANLGESG
jgi:4-hydroxy-3-methylbut-2-enyl diphosphate reductase